MTLIKKDANEEVYLYIKMFRCNDEWRTVWPSGQRIGFAVLRSWVQGPLWPLALFVYRRPELKSSARLLNSFPFVVFNPDIFYI